MSDELKRWRLVLGRFSEEGIPGDMGRQGTRMSDALDYLYGREYSGRGVRMGPGTGGAELGGDRDRIHDPHEWDHRSVEQARARSLFPAGSRRYERYFHGRQ